MDGNSLYKKTKKVLLKWGVTEKEAEDFIKDLEATADDEEDENEAVEEKKDVKDDIAEAKDNIAEKGEDSQSDKDREDESVGEQLEEDGDKDSQTTEDRIDESEGEEKAEEKKTDNVQDDRIGTLEERINGLTEKIDQLFARLMGEEVEDGEDEAAFQAAAKRYGANAGVFNNDDTKQEKMTAKEAAEVFKNLKR